MANTGLQDSIWNMHISHILRSSFLESSLPKCIRWRTDRISALRPAVCQRKRRGLQHRHLWSPCKSPCEAVRSKPGRPMYMGGRASKGQAWARHCAPAAPAFTRPSLHSHVRDQSASSSGSPKFASLTSLNRPTGMDKARGASWAIGCRKCVHGRYHRERSVTISGFICPPTSLTNTPDDDPHPPPPTYKSSNINWASRLATNNMATVLADPWGKTRPKPNRRDTFVGRLVGK